MSTQSEAALEAGLIATLRQMDYDYVQIVEEDNLYANFKRQLEIHNRKRLEEHGRTEFTAEEFEKILIYLEGGTRFEKAKKLRDLYPLDTADGQRIWVEFLNRQQWCQNEFQVSNQITVEGRKKCRYDVTILVNGLPLVQIELKRRGVELKQAYNQIQRYHKTSFHGLFDYIQLFVISNGVNTRYFANNPNSGYKFTFTWTDAANHPFNELDKFAVFFLEKCTLGKIIGKYIVLHEGDKCLMVLRPYQFYAVEKILDRVQNSNDNGYIWHTTGAGKTLTSFKAAQLVSELDDVDKVMFVVDRHDLDTQTQSEYEAFEPGAVDSTDNTDELVKRLQSNSKIIITTIQKLNAAVSKTWYSSKIDAIRHSRIVMIFDECHRSHFGDSHKKIMKFFDNAQIFGFTGTPIFTENAVDGHTTKEIFGNCLHKYLIKDAIADENVLGFLVEYYHGNEIVDNDNQARMEEIARFILNNFNKSTFDGEFDALFAVQSVPMLIRYYKIFKSLNPKIRIGAVFTYAANNSQDDEQTGMGTGQYAKESVGEADELQAIMDDYNENFGTFFTTENFRAYYDDINLRMKKKKADMKPLDLCLVVGMFLTGFDSKKLNTLYVDKNMEYHGLLQAFSRTNRVLNEKKRFGKIVCFRDLKNNVDTAIKFILDGEEDVYVIEVNPRSSRTVPFLSKATGVPMADIATRVILGHSLREQGITEVYGRERSRWFVKAPAFSFAKIRGMESYLSPEMKSTGEAIGYDNKLTRALYKALQSSGMTVANYGTIFLTIADKDKQDALPLVRRFYDLGFNIEATKGTAEFLRQHGIRTRTRRKLSEGSTEIIDSLRQGHVSYVINTIDINQHNTRLDGYEIRRTAVENNVTIFTALETVKVLLDVLEEITLGVSTIDAE